MKKVSCGAIIFRKENGNLYFLLLKYPNYWGFPKGEQEENENEIDTAKREIKEETGIEDLKFIFGFRKEYEYSYFLKGKRINKKAIFFLAETKQKEVKISWEHEDYKWATLEEALKILTYEEDKKNLKEAYEYLKRMKYL
ncbi:MAG: NUDIX domain-containing protein [Candidatus Aenigmatarchaeota archaeon]